MNVLAQYFRERRRRVDGLPLGRWWLSEYLGRGLIGMGLGALIVGFIPESVRTSIAFGTLFVGGLVTLLFYDWRQPPIEARAGESNKQ
jgi:hypothetical protein